ncbi:alpha/beta hydrolase [Psychromonas sp. KJ10-10]|uniref:alpha/beta hydrolase n=1 Tax=Psychromonas sp. KJ10-10 TaxID=3391823 RepID=UPI0039B6B098
MRQVKLITVIVLAIVTTACTKAGLFVANLPAKLSQNTIKQSIPFTEKTGQTLDIYLPANQSKDTKLLPVVMFFYGGSWEDGNKEMYQFIGNTFANQGYIAVIADYRKYPDIAFPTFVEDGAKAVAWTYESIADYGGDKDKLYLAGHSAGAYIATMLTADNNYLAKEGLSNNIISAFAGLAGPYDFEPNTDSLKAIFKSANTNNYQGMKVSNYIEGDEPPMLLIWGEKDTTVYRRNIDLFADKIKQKKGKVETILYPEMNHTDLVKNMIWILSTDKSILNDMVTFFKRH